MKIFIYLFEFIYDFGKTLNAISKIIEKQD